MLGERSVTDLFSIACTAKVKLGKAATESEQNLRLMVGHANLLDGEQHLLGYTMKLTPPDLMDQLNVIEFLKDSAKASGKQERVESREEVEESAPEFEDDTSDDEPSEPQECESEGLSLTRWPSNPPTRLQLVDAAESKPRLRPCGPVSARRSRQQHYPVLESIAEEDRDGSESSLDPRCHGLAEVENATPVFGGSRIVLEAVPRIESGRPQIAVQVVEVAACQ